MMQRIQQIASSLNSPAVWIAAISAFAAVCSAVFSWTSWRTNRRALSLAEAQESRRLPAIALYLADAFCKYTDTSRIFAFSVAASNVSDADNSLSLVELQVHYRTATGTPMAVKVPPVPDCANAFKGQTLTLLEVPLRLDAHQTASGWLTFEVKNAVLAGAVIDTAEVLVLDAHKAVFQIEHVMFRDVSDETEVDKEGVRV